MGVLRRNLGDSLAEMLAAFRVVFLEGARQSGKTTLLRSVRSAGGSPVITLDDPAMLARAVDDPAGFVAALAPGTAIDEFQRAGEPLLLAVKARVDVNRERGQFILSGSANYLASRSVSETLAGRAARLTLWPLSIGEIHGIRENFVDRLFEPGHWPPPPGLTISRAGLVDQLLTGGYPEVVTERLSQRARRSWFDAYVGDVVSKEALRAVASIRVEDDLRRVLRLLAARTGHELVVADVARDAELSRDTTANYIALLQALYLVVLVPAWAASVTTRAKRHPKIVLTDCGLAADLVGAEADTFGVPGDGRLVGALFETFVLGELHKQAGWSDRIVALSHFRDRNGAEVDCIVEDRRAGLTAGVEVKWTATPRRHDARHLEMLRDRLGAAFTVGVLIHAGKQVLSLGERIWAVPAAALAWTG